jgi:opacity protein-like surface antigen
MNWRLFPRSFWDATHGGLPDYEANAGVGMHVLAGADYMLARNLAVGLEVRYRYLKTGALKERTSGTTVTSGMILHDGSSRTYDLDLSGVSLGINLRLFAL